MIDGLTVIERWASSEEEADILAELGDGGKTKGGPHRNRIERFGPGVVATGYVVGHRIEEEIPSCFDSIRARLAQDVPLDSDSITVNWYQPGQFITQHTDLPQAGEVIAVLSLASDATMLFSRGSGRQQQQIECPRRSLLIMRRQARWDWRHGLLPVRDFRVSAVFRRSASEPSIGPRCIA